MELTPASLKKLCKERKQYISSPELNDVLHLQCKGITRLENLHAYTGLRTLYLEQNAISVIEGLELLVNLRCLYLGKNIISTVGDGLSMLTALETLDLSENCISTISGIDSLQQLKTLNVSGNRIRSIADLSTLSGLGSTLTTLDLASNNIDDPAVLDLLSAIPLSLLRLNGNPLVSNIRHYRKIMLTRFPTLNYLDESPCFPNDRRLAAAFVRGGLDVERAERDTIRREEEALRERHRQAFDDMVAAARANPPPPHDPMRFRAVPPGDSDSSDEEGLPLSARHAKALRRQQRLLHQQTRQSSASSSSVPSTSQLLRTQVEDPAPSVAVFPATAEASPASVSNSTLPCDGSHTCSVTRPEAADSSPPAGCNMLAALQATGEAEGAAAGRLADSSGPAAAEQALPPTAQSLLQFGPPQPRPHDSRQQPAPPTGTTAVFITQASERQPPEHSGPTLPVPQLEGFRSELRDRALARAAARAGAAASTPATPGQGVCAPEGRFPHAHGQQRQQQGDAGGDGGPDGHHTRSSETGAGAEGGGARASAGPGGRHAPFVIPRVWGTPNYRRLWDMAVAAGEGQQQEQEEGEGEEGRVSRESAGQVGAVEADGVLEDGGGSSSDSDDPRQEAAAAGFEQHPDNGSVGDDASISDSAMNWAPGGVAPGAGLLLALDRTDLDSARDGESQGSPVRHLGSPAPAEDLDSARGVDLSLEDLDSAHSFHGLDQQGGSTTSSTPHSGDGHAFGEEAMEASSGSCPDSQEGTPRTPPSDAALSDGHAPAGEGTGGALSDSSGRGDPGVTGMEGHRDEMLDVGEDGMGRAAVGALDAAWPHSAHRVGEVDLFARYSITSVGRGGAGRPAPTPDPSMAALLGASTHTTLPATQPLPSGRGSRNGHPTASSPTRPTPPTSMHRSGSGELSAALLAAQSQRLHSLYSTAQPVPAAAAPLAASLTTAPGSSSSSAQRAPFPAAAISSPSRVAAAATAFPAQGLPLPVPAQAGGASPEAAVDAQALPGAMIPPESCAAYTLRTGTSGGSAPAGTTSADVVSPRHATTLGRSSRLLSSTSDSARVIHPPASWEVEQAGEGSDTPDPSGALPGQGAQPPDLAGPLIVEGLEAVEPQYLAAQGVGRMPTEEEGYVRTDSAWATLQPRDEQQRLPQRQLQLQQQQQPDSPFRSADGTPSGPWFTSVPSSSGQASNLLEQARALVGGLAGGVRDQPAPAPEPGQGLLRAAQRRLPSARR
ncbi:MAG: hypothetical protein WDW36_000007 [Sanguina aurantia]